MATPVGMPPANPLPIQAIWQHFKADSPAGMGLGWGDPVWWGSRLSGDLAQTVLVGKAGVHSRDGYFYPEYRVFVACYHPNLQVAEERAQAVVDAYAPLGGSTNAAPGLTVDGWHARTLTAESQGIVDALAITGGQLYKAQALITLITLTKV